MGFDISKCNFYSLHPISTKLRDKHPGFGRGGGIIKILGEYSRNLKHLVTGKSNCVPPCFFLTLISSNFETC